MIQLEQVFSFHFPRPEGIGADCIISGGNAPNALWKQGGAGRACRPRTPVTEREFFIDNLLVRTHFNIMEIEYSSGCDLFQRVDFARLLSISCSDTASVGVHTWWPCWY